jgi:hypothetical protein
VVPQLLGIGDGLSRPRRCGPVDGLDEQHLLRPERAQATQSSIQV